MLKKAIEHQYFFLVLATPLVVFAKTYEMFEFPKILFLYTATALILFLYALSIIKSGSFKLNRTALFLSFLMLAPQIASTATSIHPSTSFFGYYTRFNGSFLSSFCYALLFYIFITTHSSKGREKTLKSIRIGALVVSIYAIAQHMGVDKNIWVQDSQKRVFSTLGQPNWLSSYLVLVLPLFIKQYLETKNLVNKPLFLYSLVFMGFFFTYSISGLVGFAVMASALFYFLRKNSLKKISLLLSLTLFYSLLFAGPYKERIGAIKVSLARNTTALAGENEVSRTSKDDTSKIRLIVWKGTIKLIASERKRALVGTGPETFAYAFLPYRPKELNYTSEWSFIFNKPHNYLLETLVETGILGVVSAVLILLIVFKKRSSYSKYVIPGILGVGATYFFGWATVSTDLISTVFLGLIVAGATKNTRIKKGYSAISLFFIAFSLFLIFISARTLTADMHFNKGLRLARYGKGDLAQREFLKAVAENPTIPRYKLFLAKEKALLGNFDESSKLIESAIKYSKSDMVSLKTAGGIYQNVNDKDMLRKSADIYKKAIALCPTDPENYLNLAKVYLKLGKDTAARDNLKKALNLKSDYKEAENKLVQIKEPVSYSETTFLR